MAQITEEDVAKLKAAAKRKRETALGAEVMGLAILSLGLGMAWRWVGVACFGLGVLLIGIGTELG